MVVVVAVVVGHHFQWSMEFVGLCVCVEEEEEGGGGAMYAALYIWYAAPLLQQL